MTRRYFRRFTWSIRCSANPSCGCHHGSSIVQVGTPLTAERASCYAGDMPLTGECFCGAVAYRIDGPLSAARACHCSRCRKAFSGAASAYALVEPSSWTWVRGEKLLTCYVGSHGAGKQFCSLCGSMLCGIVAGEVHGVALGSLNEDPGIEIEMHLFVGSKAAWDVVPAHVVQHQGFPPEWELLAPRTAAGKHGPRG